MIYINTLVKIWWDTFHKTNLIYIPGGQLKLNFYCIDIDMQYYNKYIVILWNRKCSCCKWFKLSNAEPPCRTNIHLRPAFPCVRSWVPISSFHDGIFESSWRDSLQGMRMFTEMFPGKLFWHFAKQLGQDRISRFVRTSSMFCVTVFVVEYFSRIQFELHIAPVRL